MNTVSILERLVAIPSVTGGPNGPMVSCVVELLRGFGIGAELWRSGDRANVFATIGSAGPGGMILSGHTDVVPVEGQPWSSDPFRLTERDGRLCGRGTADMKGFLACMLALAGRIDPARLRRPIHLCFSHDEEIGCVGVRPMLAILAERRLGAEACIVGEPTGLDVVIGHKGKLAATATCRGTAGHSARAPEALNAIHLAADLIAVLRREQARLEVEGARDPAYDIPYSTIHAGLIRGGTALNIVPDHCAVEFEIRTVAADDGASLLARIGAQAAAIEAEARRAYPSAAVTIEMVNAYPGLETSPDSDAAQLVASLSGTTSFSKVAYGTEGGLFHDILGVPTVVCGPGLMRDAHKADEFITHEQLQGCDAMLDRLVDHLSG